VSIGVGAGGAGRSERSHPADNHERGIENSDQPHSTQTCTSGDGVMGGWLKVRGALRERRISAGITETALDWHFGQTIHYTSKTDNRLMNST
jgi:hypothetical protein